MSVHTVATHSFINVASEYPLFIFNPNSTHGNAAHVFASYKVPSIKVLKMVGFETVFLSVLTTFLGISLLHTLNAVQSRSAACSSEFS